MNQEQPKQEFCKKLSYKNSDDENIKTTIILGIIKSQDEHFLVFRTARKEYTLSKKCIISIEDTKQIFQEVRE